MAFNKYSKIIYKQVSEETGEIEITLVELPLALETSIISLLTQLRYGMSIDFDGDAVILHDEDFIDIAGLSLCKITGYFDYPVYNYLANTAREYDIKISHIGIE